MANTSCLVKTYGRWKSSNHVGESWLFPEKNKVEVFDIFSDESFPSTDHSSKLEKENSCLSTGIWNEIPKNCSTIENRYLRKKSRKDYSIYFDSPEYLLRHKKSRNKSNFTSKNVKKSQNCDTRIKNQQVNQTNIKLKEQCDFSDIEKYSLVMSDTSSEKANIKRASGENSGFINILEPKSKRNPELIEGNVGAISLGNDKLIKKTNLSSNSHLTSCSNISSEVECPSNSKINFSFYNTSTNNNSPSFGFTNKKVETSTPVSTMKYLPNIFKKRLNVSEIKILESFKPEVTEISRNDHSSTSPGQLKILKCKAALLRLQNSSLSYVSDGNRLSLGSRIKMDSVEKQNNVISISSRLSMNEISKHIELSSDSEIEKFRCESKTDKFSISSSSKSKYFSANSNKYSDDLFDTTDSELKGNNDLKLSLYSDNEVNFNPKILEIINDISHGTINLTSDKEEFYKCDISSELCLSRLFNCKEVSFELHNGECMVVWNVNETEKECNLQTEQNIRKSFFRDNDVEISILSNSEDVKNYNCSNSMLFSDSNHETNKSVFSQISADKESETLYQLNSLIYTEHVLSGIFKKLKPFLLPHVNVESINVDVSEVSSCETSFLTVSKILESNLISQNKVLKICNQSRLNKFVESLPPKLLRNCQKIGEGVYGEVFSMKNNSGESVVFKIVPIEGNININGEQQKKFEEILSEIVISLELSALHEGQMFSTTNFIHINRICCTQGNYPKRLLKAWDDFSKKKITENEKPDIFDDDQLFIIFEFANGGTDIESFETLTIKQAKSVLLQTVAALAVAEQALEFEHRDMHWGNLLVETTTEFFLSYQIKNERFSFPTEGLKVNIIDFTLSRIAKGKNIIYLNLSADAELFLGEGDYQFDIYRSMKENNGNDWKTFNPYSNVLWLHYLTDKLIKEVTYPKICRLSTALTEFKFFYNSLLNFKSAYEILTCSSFCLQLKQ